MVRHKSDKPDLRAVLTALDEQWHIEVPDSFRQQYIKIGEAGCRDALSGDLYSEDVDFNTDNALLNTLGGRLSGADKQKVAAILRRSAPLNEQVEEAAGDVANVMRKMLKVLQYQYQFSYPRSDRWSPGLIDPVQLYIPARLPGIPVEDAVVSVSHEGVMLESTGIAENAITGSDPRQGIGDNMISAAMSQQLLNLQKWGVGGMTIEIRGRDPVQKRSITIPPSESFPASELENFAAQYLRLAEVHRELSGLLNSLRDCFKSRLCSY